MTPQVQFSASVSAYRVGRALFHYLESGFGRGNGDGIVEDEMRRLVHLRQR